MNEPCHFLKSTGVCSALSVRECYSPETCSFYETHAQYVEELDRSINICRAKNLCKGCEYMPGRKCKLSTENIDGMGVVK